jgi:AraC-like DNA-binding protein
MTYQEIIPDPRLRSNVKCYYIYESSSDATFDDTVFPSGCLEIIFNLGTGQWQTARGERFVITPPIELWGQIIQPLTVRSCGKNIMLGVRFLPHGAACFFREKLDRFNDSVLDLRDVAGMEEGETGSAGVAALHARLQNTADWSARIGLVEEFLLHQLSLAEERLDKVAVVNDIMSELRSEDFFDNISNVASRYGISSRYLQKLFLQYTGLTPKLYNKIHRFQRSLRLVSQNDLSLTSIAYDCGYFDQSHFIREFKSFTGCTPSGYAAATSPITLAVAQA